MTDPVCAAPGEARKPFLSRRLFRRVLATIAVLLGLGALGLYGATVYFLRKAFTHRVEKLKNVPEGVGLNGRTVELTSSDGIPLKGWWIPAVEDAGAVLVLHGMDGLDASCLLPHAKFLHDAGWSAFVLDMRAHGRSGGRRIGLAMEEPRDACAALDWLGQQSSLKGKPVVILGFSMGGATAIRTAAARPDVDAVVSVSAFASFEPLMGSGLQLWLGRLGILTLYRTWAPNAQPIHDISRISPRPVLLMHGTADQQIPVQDAYLLKEAGGPQVELRIVEGADHLVFTEDGNGKGRADTEYRTRVLDFLARVRHRSGPPAAQAVSPANPLVE
jgi:alpha-beta hydrolase superfamily lysophospholipase